MFNRRLLFNGAGGGNVVNHDFGLLVGTFDDVMIGIYHRGYFNSGQRRSYEEVKNDTGFVFIGAGQSDIFNNGYSPL